MNLWWDKKIDKASLVETLHKTAQLVEKYEKYEFGICNLMPKRVLENVQYAAQSIKKLEKVSVYYAEMEKAYIALQVLNNMKTAQDPKLAARAYGQLLQTLGMVVSDLPAPASVYGRALDNIGKSFEKIVGILMPSAHGSGLDSDLQDFLKGGQKFINGV